MLWQDSMKVMMSHFKKCGYQIRYGLDNVKRQNTVKICNSAPDGFISHLYYCSTSKKSKLDLLGRQHGRVVWIMSMVHTGKMTLNFSQLIHTWKKKATKYKKLNTEQTLTCLLFTYSIKVCIFASSFIKVFPSNLQSLIIIANFFLLYQRLNEKLGYQQQSHPQTATNWAIYPSPKMGKPLAVFQEPET